MSKLSTLTLTGSSGNKYTFDVYSSSTKFESFACVFCISKRYLANDNKFTHTLIYIGKSDNMSLFDFDNHDKNLCFKQNNANCISILKSNLDSEREAIESDLVKYYSPICN